MLNFSIIASYLVIAVALVVWTLILRGREDFIKSREKMVGQREVNCDRRCEIIEDAENALDSKFSLASKWIENAVEITACYVVTESDELKYTTEQSIRNVARNRIAHNVAFDLIHKFDPVEEKTELGSTKYTYRFKVLEDK